MKRITRVYRGPKIHIKKSRFIATIFPIENESEIEKTTNSINQEMNKASHNTYAFRLKNHTKITDGFDDDGEVRNTAGLQILNQLEQFKAINVILFVTRFYGGINLGKGGLIRAYSKTARELLENIPLIDVV